MKDDGNLSNEKKIVLASMINCEKRETVRVA